MKVLKVKKLDEKYTQYDISTETENFYIKSGERYLLVHNSPAIICGKDPQDGKFFVATKSAFNKVPKLAKTPDDVKEHFGEKQGLYEKMLTALKYLPDLKIPGVWQGDMMFTQDDLEDKTIDDKEYITFTPNTITYAVPIGSDLANKIRKSKMGIIFHTEYEGDGFPDMSAKFGVKVGNLSESEDVWVDDAYFKDYTGIATLSDSENDEVNQLLTKIQNNADQISKEDFDMFLDNKDFSKHIHLYINKRIREKGTQIERPESFLSGFTKFFEDRMMMEAGKLKGGAGSAAYKKRLERIDAQKEFIETHKNIMVRILFIYIMVITAKMKLIKKMNSIDGLGTFIRTDDGFEITNPEGFVAIGHDGNAVKLNDRLEFNRKNFILDKAWKK